MSRQPGLGLDDPTRPVPTRPSLIHAVGGQAQLEPFDDLRALARRALQLAGPQARGLRLAAERATCAYPGLELFPAWSLYAIDAAGDEDWLASCAVQDTPRDVLEAAIGAIVAAARQGRAA